ncbi:MAG: ATP-binding protein [Acidobacteriota bacterium]
MGNKRFIHQLLYFTTIILAGISTVLGSVVLIGWYTHNITLIQVFPTFVPMQYNTALGFLLCGLGLLSLSSEQKRLSLIFYTLVGAIGFFTLVQYISGADFGIDQLFMEHYITIETSHPGRMAPNTALCFMLSSFALLIINKFSKFKLCNLIVGISGSVIIALGVVAFLGYLSEVETAYGWGNLTRMAVHTALGFVTVGTGIFFLAWREGIAKNGRLYPEWIAIPSGIGVATIFLALWQAMMAQIDADQSDTLPFVVLGTGLLMALFILLTIRSAQTLSYRTADLERLNQELEEHITARKRTEDRLRKSEEKLRNLIENIPIGIGMSTPHSESGITEINSALWKMFGYKNAEEYKKIPASVHYCNPQERVAISKLLQEKGKVFGYETQFKRKDGSVFWGSTSSTTHIADDGELQFINTLIDISKRKKLTAQLLHSQKMESIGRLAGGVAHDFNNMLGVILGYSEMALDKMNPSQELDDALTEIHKAAQRSADLTRQLLAFARKQVIQPKVLQLNDTVAEALKFLKRLIGEDINLVWLPGKELWPVKIDPSQIDQVLANLCVNAKDAIEGVGKITIETENFIVDKAYCIDRPGLIPGEYVTLSVTDTGQGIDKKTMNNIFEPFFTTKPQGEGTGLGLATVYGIAKQNNGFIFASSEPGEHTTFRIYLPRYSGETESGKKVHEIVKTQTGTETILLVEDEEAILTLVKLFLENMGYTVTAESSSRSALQIFRENPDRFHLLITDMVIPEMSGRDLSSELQAIRPDLKCLFISGHLSKGTSSRIRIEENEHFLQKPFSQKDLATKVREALEVNHQ